MDKQQQRQQRLFRLTSQSSDGVFNTRFDEDVEIAPGSSIALQSASFDRQSARLTINADNQNVSFGLINPTVTGIADWTAKMDTGTFSQLVDGESVLASTAANMNAEIGMNLPAKWFTANTFFYSMDKGSQWQMQLDAEGKTEIAAKTNGALPISNYFYSLTESFADTTTLASSLDPEILPEITQEVVGGQALDYMSRETGGDGTANYNECYVFGDIRVTKGAGCVRVRLGEIADTVTGTGVCATIGLVKDKSKLTSGTISDTDIAWGLQIAGKDSPYQYKEGVNSPWQDVFKGNNDVTGYLDLPAGNNWTQNPGGITETFDTTDLGTLATFRRQQTGGGVTWWEATSETAWNVYTSKPSFGSTPATTAEADLTTGQLNLAGGVISFSPNAPFTTVVDNTCKPERHSRSGGSSNRNDVLEIVMGARGGTGVITPGGLKKTILMNIHQLTAGKILATSNTASFYPPISEDWYYFVSFHKPEDDFKLDMMEVDLDPYLNLTPQDVPDQIMLIQKSNLTTVVRAGRPTKSDGFDALAAEGRFSWGGSEVGDFFGYEYSNPQIIPGSFPGSNYYKFISDVRAEFSVTAKNYLVLFDELPLNSFDSYSRFDNNARNANSGGSRRNLLATVPVKEDQLLSSSVSQVAFEPNTLDYISLRNTSTYLTRTLTCRILTSTYQPIEVDGMASLTLLIRD